MTVGVGMALNKQYYRDMLQAFCDNKPVLYFGGLMALTTGFLIVTFHNTWEGNWTILISIIGWIALTKGIWILVFPEQAIKQSRKMMKNPQWAFFFSLGIGIFLGYCSFIIN